MKTPRSVHDRAPQGHDTISFLIEVVWRSGRALLETSMWCILGVIVFSQLGTLAWLVGAFTSLPTKQIPQFMPAVGWTVGLLVGLFRMVTTLRKPFGVPIEDADDAPNPPDSPEQPGTPSRHREVDLKAKSTRALRAGGIGGLLGLIAGFFLSLMLIVVCTAGILSPLAPRRWRDGFRMETIAKERHGIPSNSFERDDGTGASFWHPVYGSILKWTLPKTAMVGCVFCILAKDEETKS
ncbi:hypothetical protein Enr13x_44710 [Stieleria neptunia]|uniref:Uncharacterized protein n=1 Tax=Stieleria neptunia TaxID=2527979 RepID=A0A518HUW7_9BACT|nr:hypothetical protein [Stieleria neptunia]QDV44603.1 hypothetical protein Enr13x_44710 [Stieleria neptunia]